MRIDYNIAEYDELFAETQGSFGAFDDADLYRILAATGSWAPGFRSGYDGTRIPDFVANARVACGWGSAQVMGATLSVR